VDQDYDGCRRRRIAHDFTHTDIPDQTLKPTTDLAEFTDKTLSKEKSPVCRGNLAWQD
jgi:hypothetical protein